MDVQKARERLFAKDETFGYIDRERAIDEFLAKGNVPENQGERYVAALEYMMTQLSPLIIGDDLILGRMAEGPLPYELEYVPGNGFSHVGNPFPPTGGRDGGHMNLNYASLLENGLGGIAAKMEANAKTDTQKKYASLARRAAEAVRGYAARYADEAEKTGRDRAAKALRQVPYGPAYDMFSAVQSIWLVQMILSCATGGRDFAFSRLDVVLMPFYKKEEEDDILEILTALCLKCNEIGGLSSDLSDRMPIPCTSTNNYLMLGGKGAEHALPMSLLFLKAAHAVHLPQPIPAMRMSKDSPMEWKLACAKASQELDGQVAYYNDDVLIPNLIELGYPEEYALNYTMSGCNRVDYPGHRSADGYHNTVGLFLRTYHQEDVHDLDSLIEAFKVNMKWEAETFEGCQLFDPEEDMHFFLESMLLRGCVENVCDLENGGQDMQTVVHNLTGMATIGNSLAAIEKAVYIDKLLTFDELRDLVKNNFEGNPELHQLIRNRYPKYGNDIERVDRWTSIAANIMVDAVRQMNDGRYDRLHIPSLYSLFFHHELGEMIGATPDGRLAGEAISESQSPTYGTDKEGITALLQSVSQLPHNKIGCGGLNVRIEKKLPDEMVVALVDTYFALGGMNMCLTVLNRDTLLAAMEHPEEYQTLCVRIVGYSEVFVRLPDYMKQELLDRTAVAV
ncbi:MAG: hypothetical protein J6L88_03660 [Clostridia bacterium]|nr:hypothetical protein [Clostridia bacterium]